MAAGARKCPSCRWSPEKERERSREFWWALVVFGGVFFATALAVYIVAARLHIG